VVLGYYKLHNKKYHVKEITDNKYLNEIIVYRRLNYDKI
jgi:hypothetical protein